MKFILDHNLFGVVWRQFFNYFHYYITALICLYGTHYLQSFIPELSKSIADNFSNPLKLDEIIKSLLFLAIGIIIVRTFSRLLFFYPARLIQRDIRVEIVKRLERSNPKNYEKFNSGQLFQIVGEDMEQFRALLGFGFLQVANIFFALIVLVPKLHEFNSDLLIALLPMGIGFVLFTALVSSKAKYFKLNQDRMGDVKNFLMETYVGKKTIKNFHKEGEFLNQFKDRSWGELAIFYKASLSVGFAKPLIALGVGFSLIWGSHIIFNSDMGPSDIIVFSGFIFLFMEPLAFLSWIGIVFARSFSSWRRIKDLINNLNELEKVEHKFELWGEKVEINEPDQKWTCLVGKTGSGKSYLLENLGIKLIDEGKSISMVFQAPYLFNDTLIKNIILGKEDSIELRNEVYDLLKVFQLDFLARDKEDLLDLNVGEHGTLLSGGQAKRVAIIRSLISRSEVLIWDDPFSSVDMNLENEIIDELKKRNYLKNKTIYLSSHRVSTVRHSDQILYIEKDKGIVERKAVSEFSKSKTLIEEFFKEQLIKV